MTVRAEVVFADVLEMVDVLSGGTQVTSPGRARPESVTAFLSYLAGEMTRLVRHREEERRRFLGWLEAHIHCPITSLRGSDVVTNYDAQPDGVEALLRALEQNHPRRVRPNLGRPLAYGAANPARDAVVDGFETSMKYLRPLAARIELTDRLIDLVVFRLYRLTPDEIGLIDRAATGRPGNTASPT